MSQQREGVESECVSRVLRGREFIAKEFTAKDTAAAAAAMYTFDFGGGGGKDVRQEPVQAAGLCAGLEGEEEEGDSKKAERIKGVRDALGLVMAALRKLPVVEGCVTLYRGVRREVDLRQCKEGRDCCVGCVLVHIA